MFGTLQLGLGLTSRQGVGDARPWRNVITRTSMPVVKLTGTAYQIMAKRKHYLRAEARRFRIVIPHCWNGTEASPGPGQYTASLEYDGTFKQFLFDGLSTKIIADSAAALVISDTLDFGEDIPADSLITLNIWASIDGGFHYMNGGDNPTLGDRTAFGVTTPDLTMGGSVTHAGNAFSAVALLAQADVQSVFLLGDSRTAGAEASDIGAPGDIGELARSIGAAGLPYINAGFGGGTASAFNLSSGDLRRSLVQYTTDVIEHMGINDIANGADGATIFARRQTSWQWFRDNHPDKPLYATTIGPDSRPSNEEPISDNVDRVYLNDAIRDADPAPDGVVGYFEIADVVETDRDSGLYKDGYSTDFLHMNNTGNEALRDSGEIRLYSSIARELFERYTVSPVNKHRRALSRLIDGLNDEGLWSLLDGLWIFKSWDSQAAYLNLLGAAYTATPVSSPTFTAYEGVAGNGTSYVNLGFNPATAVAPKFTRNSGHTSFGDRTSRAANGTLQMGAAVGANFAVSMISRFTGDLGGGRINTASASSITYANTENVGRYLMSRTGASALAAYKDGASKGTSTAASVAVVSADVFLGALNVAGAPNFRSSDQFSYASIGAGFDDTQAATFDALIAECLDGMIA